MSSSVYGIKPPDDKWLKMKAIYDACGEAGVVTPKEVDDFFGHETPDDKGVIVRLKNGPCCSAYNAEMADGFEVDISKLPKDVTIIRFVNTY